MQDKSLQARVEADLFRDPRLDAASIGAAAPDGRVTPGGSIAACAGTPDTGQAAQAAAIPVSVDCGRATLTGDAQPWPKGPVLDHDARPAPGGDAVSDPTTVAT